MAVLYDKTYYYVDFSKNDKLTNEQKSTLENIQDTYSPLERAAYLTEYKLLGLITDDEYEKMTGIPYRYD